MKSRIFTKSQQL